MMDVHGWEVSGPKERLCFEDPFLPKRENNPRRLPSQPFGAGPHSPRTTALLFFKIAVSLVFLTKKKGGRRSRLGGRQ